MKIDVLPAVVLAIGLAAGGWFAGQGFVASRTVDRFVTVKGVAERAVQADVAIWSLRFVSTDDDLARALAEIERSQTTILEFLEDQGIDGDTVEVQRLDVTDNLANPYRSGPVATRYIIDQTLMVRSDDPPRIRSASQQVSRLVDAGVVLSNEGGFDVGPTYLFTRLNDFKPEMIAEATSSARQAAEQFAQDSGSQVGGIRRANQGVFVVMPRDPTMGASEESQLDKQLRVVATLDYYLR